MSPAYKEFEDFLKTIHKRPNHRVYDLIKCASNKVLKSIIEIAYNLLKGSIPITETDINNLRKHKKHIKTLVSKRVRLYKKRKIIEDNPRMLKHMLSVIFK